MYNRYITDAGARTRVLEEDAPPFRPPDPGPRFRPAPPPGPAPSPPPADISALEKGLSGLLRRLKLDRGDILLLLILLFLFLEGDDMELVITLGLLLLLGLD